VHQYLLLASIINLQVVVARGEPQAAIEEIGRLDTEVPGLEFEHFGE